MKGIRWHSSARWGLPVMGACLLAAACSNTSPTSVPMTSRMSVYLRDAPASGSVDSVWVQINDVQLVGDTGSVSVLTAPTGLINVTALRDTVATLTAGMQVDSGSYSQVRFVLGGAVLETTTGEVYTMGGVTPPDGLSSTGTLQCPSCAQSGLKVILPGSVHVGMGSDNGLLLDFDVSQSFGHQAGNSGMWVMHPVILGAVAAPGTIKGGGVGGTISGTVVLGTDSAGNAITLPVCGLDSAVASLTDFVPTATTTTVTDSAGNDIMFSGQTDSTGVFKIKVPTYDTYSLGFTAQTPVDSMQLNWQATVTPAQATVDSTQAVVDSVTYTVTGVTCTAVTP